MAAAEIAQLIKANKAMIFSKSYCPCVASSARGRESARRTGAAAPRCTLPVLACSPARLLACSQLRARPEASPRPYRRSAAPRYCDAAKAAFKRVGVAPHVIELDERDDGSAFQTVLGQMTGATSVPRVFIGGVFLGGGDDTVAAEKSGKLAKLLKDAGALA